MNSGKVLSLLGLAGLTVFGTVACVKATTPDEAMLRPEVGAEEVAQTRKVEATGIPVAEKGWEEQVLVKGMNIPWGLDFLPDGKMLVSEKAGQLYIIDPNTGSKTQVSGLPQISVIGQGGLMDVSLHPNFKENGWVYLTVAQGSNEGNHTVLVRGKLVGNKLEGAKVLFTPNFNKPGGQHFGSRILWLPDGTLLMSLGDGGNPPNAMNGKLTRHYVQDMDSHFGKILRLDENGKVPKDNPFVDEAGAAPEIYSLGHRNVQGLTIDPSSGRVYENEHGARGGDEVNLIEKGKNYGWPLATFSIEYSGPKISDNTSLPGMVDPIVAWTPCPAPSAIVFYSGDKYGDWKGDLFSAGLAGMDIRRIDLDASGKVLGMTRMEMRDRVRDVVQGPDGYLYAMMEGNNGRISRIVRK